MANGPSCPLCGTANASELLAAERDYWRCAECALVFVSPDQRPAFEEESRRYRLHRNDAQDAAYLAFLSRLADPMIAATPVGSRGLDYGCGPTPALAQLLTESGRPTESYDPLFFPDDSVLARAADFVTCSEVAEHAHDPRALLETLGRVVKPGGRVGIMTRWYDGRDFAAWGYRRDVTHVCFFAQHTMRWIGEQFGWELFLPARDVALFATRRDRTAR